MTNATRIAAVAAVVLVVVSTGGVATAVQQPGVQQAETVDCAYPIEVTDATGEAVTLQEEPREVVVLGPSTAQVMWEIGAKSKVTGMPVNFATAYLDGSANRTNVVDAKGLPVAETIVDLDPDLVLTPNIIQNETVENLRSKGLSVVRFEAATSVDDVAAKTRLIGRLVGNYQQAATVSARTIATVEAVREATSNGSNPTVYYAMGGGYTAGTETFIGDVIDAAGGDNVAEAAGIEQYKVISEETLVTEDPDWIVTTGGRPLRKSAAINATTAVENDQFVTVNGNYLSQPGPRVTQPLRTLAGTFHPESAGDLSIDPGSVSVPACAGSVVTADNSSTETVRITTAANGTATDSDGTGSGSGPGFGAVGALLALAVSGFVARRR